MLSLGKKIYQLPKEDGNGWERPEYKFSKSMDVPLEESAALPSTFISFAPIVIPIILIIFNTVLSGLKLKQLGAQYLIFLGNPVIAVGIGVIVTIYGLTPKLSREEVIKIWKKELLPQV